MKAIKKHRRDVPVFGDMMMDLFKDDFFHPVTRRAEGTFTPSVNIKESDTKFTIELVAPGMNKKDMNIDLDGNKLTISAENKVEKEETEEKYTRKEFSYKSFSRTFTLPENANDKSIQASYEDGILMVNIPKKEPDSKKLRTIKIS